MDLLKRELERKKKALKEVKKEVIAALPVVTTSSSFRNIINSNKNQQITSDHSSRRRYLNTSQLRQIQNEKEDYIRNKEKNRDRYYKESHDQKQIEQQHVSTSDVVHEQHPHNEIVDHSANDDDNKHLKNNDGKRKLNDDQILNDHNNNNNDNVDHDGIVIKKKKKKVTIQKSTTSEQAQQGMNSSHQGGQESMNDLSENNGTRKDSKNVESSDNMIQSDDRYNDNDNDISILQHRYSPDEVTKRLRLFGLPVRLFGELTTSSKKIIVAGSNDNNNEEETITIQYDDTKRLKRLHEALLQQKESLEHLSEQDEYRLGRAYTIRNPFLEKHNRHNNNNDDDDDINEVRSPDFVQQVTFASSSSKIGNTNPTDSNTMSSSNNDISAKESKKKKTDNSSNSNEDGKQHDHNDNDNDLNDDPHKLVYRYFKGLLKEWESDLLKRSDEMKRSMIGKNETNTLKQCKDYIRPLFKLCKNRIIEDNMLQQLVKIVNYCKIDEFVKAHDAYMDVAIGRAAWPIGVTMVGIHARTGRSKIESQNVAHVMNSELQRKYLTSVKRLLTYIQKKRIDVDPSKKVLN